MSQGQTIVDIVRKYKSSTPETLMGVYDDIADIYDEVIYDFQVDGHKLTTEAAKRMIQSKSSRILDFASGTGQLGEKMYKDGYTNIDAFDGSAASIEIARKKNIYKNLIVEFVGENKISIDDDVYDALLCYGAFAGNHLPISVFSEWIRCVKPGGYIINTFRGLWLDEEPRYNEGKLLGEITRLEEEGQWKRIIKETLEHSDRTRVVHNYVYQVL